MVSQVSSQLKEMNSNETLAKLVLGSVASTNSRREKPIEKCNINADGLGEQSIRSDLPHSAMSKDKDSVSTSKHYKMQSQV